MANIRIYQVRREQLIVQNVSRIFNLEQDGVVLVSPEGTLALPVSEQRYFLEEGKEWNVRGVSVGEEEDWADRPSTSHRNVSWKNAIEESENGLPWCGYWQRCTFECVVILPVGLVCICMGAGQPSRLRTNAIYPRALRSHTGA